MSSEKLESLGHLLGCYKEDELFALARNYKMRGYSLLDRGKLIENLQQSIMQEACFVLSLLGQEELEMIAKITSNKSVQLQELNQDLVQAVIGLGWGRLALQGQQQIIYIAEEIRSLYQEQIVSEVFRHQHYEMQQLRKYRNALLNLYGIVEMTWLKQIYQRDIGRTLDMRVFVKALEMINRIYKGCEVVSYYIVHESLYGIEEEFKHFKSMASGYDYYEPTKEEVDAFENEFYYVDTLATKRVKEYLKNHCQLEADIADFAVAVLSVHMRIQEDVKMVNMLQVLEEWYRLGIRVGGIKQLEGMIPLVLQMMEETRMWRLRGQTPYEIGITLSPVIAKAGRVTKEKIQVGRNEECPCGSGKKYKKCCLNKNE
ncbi:MAG: SEC-C metal-binding domain-containing protein [Cellulosilyticaceae bacterium]